MKQITAWQAEDGTQFFNEVDCIKHESRSVFGAWYNQHLIEYSDSNGILDWLQENAEDIRGFLPPVEAKPELDIKILEAAAFNHGRESDVRIKDVKRWLAGELE